MARFSRQVCHWTYAVTLLAVSNAFVVPCSRIVTKKRIHTRNINSPQLLTFVDELQKYASKDSNCEGFGMKNGIKRIFSKQSITSLQTEGLRVHSAFPKLLKGAFRFALGRVGVIMMFTAFSYIISPYFGRQVLTQLVNILIALSHMTSNIVSGLFFFPIALLVLLALLVPVPFIYLFLQLPESPIKMILVACSKTYMTAVQTLIGSVVRLVTNVDFGSRTILDWASESPLLLYFGAILLAPILEETIYRSFFLSGIKRLWTINVQDKKGDVDNVVKDNKSIANQTENKKNSEILGHTPWVLISSILFAVSHASNYVGPFLQGFNINPSNELAVIQLVTSALIQCFVAAYVSLTIFSPTFEEKGLLAAIGAHAMWNLNANMLFITLPIRFVGRMVRRNKRN